MDNEGEGRPIQTLLVGLHKTGIDFRDGDTVHFGRRKPPTLAELEARMEAIRQEMAHEAARKRGGGF